MNEVSPGLGSCLAQQFTLFVQVADMQTNGIGVPFKQLRHLYLGQPYRLMVKLYLKTGPPFSAKYSRISFCSSVCINKSPLLVPRHSLTCRGMPNGSNPITPRHIRGKIFILYNQLSTPTFLSKVEICPFSAYSSIELALPSLYTTPVKSTTLSKHVESAFS